MRTRGVICYLVGYIAADRYRREIASVTDSDWSSKVTVRRVVVLTPHVGAKMLVILATMAVVPILSL